MNNKGRKNRGGSGNRMVAPRPRQGYHPMERRSRGGGRMRQSVDKSLLSDGVYGNPRITHAATSLIGCEVQIQVKNGCVYDGIFRTFSPKMDIVLEAAHKVDEGCPEGAVPSKDRLIEKVIFALSDIVMISSQDVELDYAARDTFTDTAISSTVKTNGQIGEKELQAWEPDMPSGDTGLEDLQPETLNGWDPNEMFKTNAERFNVESSYDPNMTQYTTPLKYENTKEFRDREARAAKMAHEIEKSESYMHHIDLENGDGDEEDKFSAVVRPENNNVQGGKYVPPHLRGKAQDGRMQRTGPGRQAPAGKPPAAQQPPTPDAEPKVNGENGEKRGNSTERNKVAETNVVSSSEKAEAQPAPKELNPAAKIETRKTSNPKFDPQLQELKDFGNNFRLSDNESKERKASGGAAAPHQGPGKAQMATPQSPQAGATPPSVPAAIPATQERTPTDDKADMEGKKEEPSEGLPQEKPSETVKKSTLNPNAKEFVFNPNAKPFQPKPQPMQVPTPPRPQTQSPVMIPQPMGPIQGQPLYPHFMGNMGNMVPVSMPMAMTGAVAPNQSRFIAPRKTATVSVQPGPRPEQVTGHPLQLPHNPQTMQAPHQQQYTVYHINGQMMSNQGPQVVPMPATGTRMMTPPMMQQQQQQQQQHGQEQNQAQPTQAIFMSPPGAQGVPQLGPHPPSGAQIHGGPAHGAPHHQATPPHSQPSHMNSQPPQQGAGHPAPSPVHQHPGHPPPTPGTPQPHILYAAAGHNPQQPGAQHPPLQPSPHTPTSPQSNNPPYLSNLTNHQHQHIPYMQYTPYSSQQMVQQGAGQLSQGGIPPGAAGGVLQGGIPHGAQVASVTYPQQQHMHPTVTHAAGQQQPGQHGGAGGGGPGPSQQQQQAAHLQAMQQPIMMMQAAAAAQHPQNASQAPQQANLGPNPTGAGQGPPSQMQHAHHLQHHMQGPGGMMAGQGHHMAMQHSMNVSQGTPLHPQAVHYVQHQMAAQGHPQGLQFQHSQ